MSAAPHPENHVAFLLPDMGGGGAERLTLDLLAGFVARGCRVDLLLQRCEGDFLPMVPPEVQIIDLSAPRLRDVRRPLRHYLRTARPDALLAAMWPLTTMAVASAHGLKTRIILSDHCALREQYAGNAGTLLALRASVFASYRFADAVVAVSDGVGSELAQLASIPRASITTIANPVGAPLRSGVDPDSLWRAPKGKRLLSVGKLKDQKRHSLLIDALHLLNDAEVELAIVGDGELHDALGAQAAQLGLAAQVTLPGFTVTPGDWYAGADLFALTSDYEGFGNVLVEAMHAGLTIVSTDCPYGPDEIVGYGRWGTLTPPGDSVALANAISHALRAPSDPQAQVARAAEFSVERAVDAYASLMVPQ